MAKNNIRSFRYSDEVAKILEGFEGANMNEKFENLVLYCFQAVPEKEKQLASVDRQIQCKLEQLSDLQDRFTRAYDLMIKLESIKEKVDKLFL